MESISQLLECPVCIGNFNSDKNKPYILDCGHTFCQMCVSSLSDKNENEDSFACPTCRQSIMKKSSLDKVNILTMSMADQFINSPTLSNLSISMEEP